MLTIILLTYHRTDYAIRTIEAINRNLKGDRQWYIADDSGVMNNLNTLLRKLNELGESFVGYHCNHLGYGGSMNQAWKYCRDNGRDVTLWLEDDWELMYPFDMSPYIELLEQNSDVGMVRLAHMATGWEFVSRGYDGRIYLERSRGGQYHYSGNPHLKHSRFLTNYGEMPTGLNPGNTELAYDHQIQRSPNLSKIWWPVAVGESGIFGHIGAVKSYE